MKYYKYVGCTSPIVIIYKVAEYSGLRYVIKGDRILTEEQISIERLKFLNSSDYKLISKIEFDFYLQEL
jgi:hypothetical protein